MEAAGLGGYCTIVLIYTSPSIDSLPLWTPPTYIYIQVADQLDSIQGLKQTLTSSEQETQSLQLDWERQQQSLQLQLEQEQAENNDLQVDWGGGEVGVTYCMYCARQ